MDHSDHSVAASKHSEACFGGRCSPEGDLAPVRLIAALMAVRFRQV
jgi:hypothetical protein